MNYPKFTLFFTLPISLLMLLTFSNEANGQTFLRSVANGTTSFTDPNTTTINPIDGDANIPCINDTSQACLVLGPNIAIAGRLITAASPKFFAYSQNQEFTDSVSATNQNGDTISMAISTIEVKENLTNKDNGGNSSYYEWTATTNSTVIKSSNTTGSGQSIVTDPVPFALGDIASNSIFEETVTLDSESSVFKDSEFDDANLIIDRESTLLNAPIFEITLSATTSGSVDADVFFNLDPNSGLTFSTTPLALEALLEDPGNGLGTSSGLFEDLELFSYTWDLSGFTITSTDTISGGSKSVVQSVVVPESSSNLSLLALGSLGAILTGKRIKCSR